MRITAVYAKNFRTLEDFELSFSADYCTISGRNNAGKTSVIRIIQNFLSADSHYRHYNEFEDISYVRDHTQWAEGEDLSVSIGLEIHKEDDAEVFFVVQKFSPVEISGEKAQVRLSQTFHKDGSSRIESTVNGNNLDTQTSSELLKKFRGADNIVIHNSTSPQMRYFWAQEGLTEVLESHFTSGDKKKIKDAEKTLTMRVRQAAKQHKEELGRLLGKLKESYQVELTTVDRSRSSTYPLAIKLTDKSVEVPLGDWGSGTQNRTRVMISILNAVRIRASQLPADRSTPVVIVEEPESFLHPSAQAEFGKVLNQLAAELKVQIIATTHSPYMLNQSIPKANILLDRKIFRGKLKETEIAKVDGSKWMLPFAENLGLIPSDFEELKDVFSAGADRVILVEGLIDQEYLEAVRDKYPHLYKIPADVKIIPYGGKDALKNTQLLKFLIQKFDKAFITFDRDCDSEVSKWLEKIGLVRDQDFCCVGRETPGSDCIEGLLPTEIKSKIYAEHHELVTRIVSSDTKARNDARSELKQKMLSEFKNNKYEDKDMKGLASLIKAMSAAFT